MSNRTNRMETKKNDLTLVGHLSSGSMDGLSTTVLSCSVVSGAVGFRLYPTTNAIRFAIDTDPAVAGTVNAATVGSIAKAGAWETRLLPEGSTTVRLLATVATTVDIEWF